VTSAADDTGVDRVTGGMWTTLVAMTIAASMILVDQTAVPLAVPRAVNDLGGSLDESQWIMTANILPLAAFMVLGGHLGDLLGLRRVFLTGAVVFALATTVAGLSQNMPMMIGARLVQGCSAALMMPTTMAIVSATFPSPRRGFALGVLAGGSAFFAALGPVLGGILTSLDWRLVFLVNVPLAVIAGVLTLRRPDPRGTRPKGGRVGGRVDVPGAVALALALGALVYGLSQGQASGWGSTVVVVSVGGGLVLLAAFVGIEQHSRSPLIEFRLLRHLNFLAANISQLLAGMIELGLGYLLPYLLLLVIGVDPLVAGIALIPSTLPIVLAGPLAGRAFDRIGGRAPLVVGFLLLAASGLALALAAGAVSAWALIPGLVLQGLGLGIVLTVNDPTGLTAVPERDQGVAAGMLNTSEQLGGAIGIAILVAIELSYYLDQLYDRLAVRGIRPTAAQTEQGREFILQAEQIGLNRAAEEARDNPVIQLALQDLIDAHISGFRLAFIVSAGIAVAGALASFALVRQKGREVEGPIFTRRSRWILAHPGSTPAVTRQPADAP
jgi:EmrB/QacA subfamily drug resistance transporter